MKKSVCTITFGVLTQVVTVTASHLDALQLTPSSDWVISCSETAQHQNLREQCLHWAVTFQKTGFFPIF